MVKLFAVCNIIQIEFKLATGGKLPETHWLKLRHVYQYTLLRVKVGLPSSPETPDREGVLTNDGPQGDFWWSTPHAFV